MRPTADLVAGLVNHSGQGANPAYASATVGSAPVSGYPRPQSVNPRPLREIAALLGAEVRLPRDRPPASSDGVAFTGIAHASSGVRSGDLFAALPGARQHGARFVADAAAAGAVAVLTDAAGSPAAEAAGLPALVVADPRAVLGTAAARIYGDPTDRLGVVGITGTAGKTSTAYLVEAGLRAAGHTTALIGTVETRIADTTISSVHTTPEATDLQALFAVAVERGVTTVVMEVSSHALALGRVDGTRFTVGAFTNLGVDHLDFHADLGEYFAAKARLFDGRSRHEVVNVDDPAGRKLISPDTITISAAGEPDAVWRAAGVIPEGFGQQFELYGPGGLRLPASVVGPGRHYVANALVAIACLAAVGVEPEVAVAGVASCPGVPGRMERVGVSGAVLGVVDYAHKPDAVAAVLTALRSVTDGRLICVIGAGGDRDRAKRALMGAAAANNADLLVITDDNPRGEDPAAIRADVVGGAAEVPGAVWADVAGRRAGIRHAVAAAAPGDTIAVLGKGHEQGQESAGEVHPFDDRIELAAALQEWEDTRA